jgi:hypothetical protein
MTVSVTSLQKLMSLGLTTEQMAGVIDVLAVELAPLETMRADAEARRAKDRLRKFHGNSLERSAEIPDNPPTPLVYNNKPISEGLDKSSPTPSLPKNSRHHGTNPRALGTNPRAIEQEPEGFNAFWDAYPKRDGTADRKGAVKAFKTAVKRVDGLETLVMAAARYAVHCRDSGKVGTQYVKQARSWLNGDLWREWMPPEPAAEISTTRVYVTTGTDAMDAWDDHFKRTKGKLAPRDQRGGWWFDSEYPPSTQEQAA